MKARFIYDIPERQQPDTQELRDGKNWIVEKPFWFIRNTGEVLFVPPSGIGTDADVLKKPIYTTDYGSIPMIFQNIFSKTKYGGSYLLHDFLYISETRNRKECDDILREALEVQGANIVTRNVIYRAVRLGGGFIWSRHNQRKVKELRSWAESCRSVFKIPYESLLITNQLHQR